MSDRELLALRAKEMCVRTGPKSRWMPLGERGSGPVAVTVTEGPASKVYFLRVQKSEDEETEDDEYAYADAYPQKYLLVCKITETLEYCHADSTFHYFGVDATTEYGLRFFSDNDAMDFSHKIISIKSLLRRASRKNNRRDRARGRDAQRCAKIVEETESETEKPTSPRIKPATVPARITESLDEVPVANPTPTQTADPLPVAIRNINMSNLRSHNNLPEAYVTSDPYVDFFKTDQPVEEAELQAVLLQAKMNAEKANAKAASPDADRHPQVPPASVAHPYTSIDDAANDPEEKRSDASQSTDESPADAGKSAKPVDAAPSHGSASDASPSTTHVERTAGEQAPAVQPRSELQSAVHPKLRRQHKPADSVALHLHNQRLLADHPMCITQQAQRQEINRHDTHRQEHQLNHISMRKDPPELVVVVPPRKQTEAVSPPANTSNSRHASLSQMGALYSEESRRERALRETLGKPVIKEQPLPAPSKQREKLECRHCGQYYYTDSNEVGDCEDGPSVCKSCVHCVSCLECASCLTYWFASDEENEHAFPFQCSSTHDDEDPVCCRRWTVLCIAGLCCPCLFCYWPLKCCMDVGGSFHLCGAKHAWA